MELRSIHKTTKLFFKKSLIKKLNDLSWQRITILISLLVVCAGIGFFLAGDRYLSALALFAIPLSFIIFLSPYAGVLIFISLTYVRPQDFIPELMDKPIIFWLMLITFGSWLARSMALRDKDFFKAAHNYLLIALLLVATISGVRVWLVYAKDSFIEILKIFLLYTLIVNLTNTHEKLGKAFWFMLAGTFYIAILGVLQHYEIVPWLTGIIPERNHGRIQGLGIFDNPNYLAYGTAFMIPFALYAFYYMRPWPAKFVPLLAIIVILPCIRFTGSRGGLLCAAITILFCIFQDRSKKITIIGAIICLAALFMLLKKVPILNTVRDYSHDESAMGRISAWYNGFNMLRASPLLGIGYMQFNEKWGLDSHNSYVEIGTELGVIGLFAWVGLLYWSYKYLHDVVKCLDGTEARWQIAYVKSLKATLVAYAFGSCFASLGYFMLLYVFHSFSVVAGRLYLPEEKRREIARVRLKDLFAISGIEAGILFVWFAFPRL